MSINYKEINTNDPIHFIPLTEKGGKAYFQFCPVFNEKGRLMKIYISPSQQPDKIGQGWFITIDNTDDYQQIIIEDRPLYSMIFGTPHLSYCSEHKTVCFEMSVPNNSNVLVCDHIGSDVWFKFMEEV